MQITKAGLLEVPLASQTLLFIPYLFVLLLINKRLTFNYVLIFLVPDEPPTIPPTLTPPPPPSTNTITVVLPPPDQIETGVVE